VITCYNIWLSSRPNDNGWGKCQHYTWHYCIFWKQCQLHTYVYSRQKSIILQYCKPFVSYSYEAAC